MKKKKRPDSFIGRLNCPTGLYITGNATLAIIFKFEAFPEVPKKKKLKIIEEKKRTEILVKT